jgi:hypothetical protein
MYSPELALWLRTRSHTSADGDSHLNVKDILVDRDISRQWAAALTEEIDDENIVKESAERPAHSLERLSLQEGPI